MTSVLGLRDNQWGGRQQLQVNAHGTDLGKCAMNIRSRLRYPPCGGDLNNFAFISYFLRISLQILVGIAAEIFCAFTLLYINNKFNSISRNDPVSFQRNHPGYFQPLWGFCGFGGLTTRSPPPQKKKTFYNEQIL